MWLDILHFLFFSFLPQSLSFLSLPLSLPFFLFVFIFNLVSFSLVVFSFPFLSFSFSSSYFRSFLPPPVLSRTKAWPASCLSLGGSPTECVPSPPPLPELLALGWDERACRCYRLLKGPLFHAVPQGRILQAVSWECPEYVDEGCKEFTWVSPGS